MTVSRRAFLISDQRCRPLTASGMVESGRMWMASRNASSIATGRAASSSFAGGGEGDAMGGGLRSSRPDGQAFVEIVAPRLVRGSLTAP
jgi:hypothetical protein